MANIVYTLRVSPQTAQEIARMSSVYGSKSPRAFAREILEVMCSADEQRVTAFLTRLFERITGQMLLNITAPVVELKAKPSNEPKPKKTKRRMRQRVRRVRN